MLIITTKTDIRNYVNDTHADYVEHGAGDALVDAIQAADHPAWGADWAEWFEANVDQLRIASIA